MAINSLRLLEEVVGAVVEEEAAVVGAVVEGV